MAGCPDVAVDSGGDTPEMPVSAVMAGSPRHSGCVGDGERVELAVRVFVLDADIGDVEADAVMDADAPGERGGDEDALVVDDALTVVVEVSEPVDVPLRVSVAVPESLLVGDAVGV